jgi:hypothetical protein
VDKKGFSRGPLCGGSDVSASTGRERMPFVWGEGDEAVQDAERSKVQ